MNTNITKLSHHEQQELCSTRPSYRQGRKLTAVKVYTVCDESVHLLVSRVPALKLHAELSALCGRFGTVTGCALVPGYDCGEAFVETYHVQYERLQSARFAKRQLDGRSFFGGVLHVCYAPELEMVNETRAKLAVRRKEVASRVRKRAKNATDNGSSSLNNGDFSKLAQPQEIPQNTRLQSTPSYQPLQKVQTYPSGQQAVATSPVTTWPQTQAMASIPTTTSSQPQPVAFMPEPTLKPSTQPVSRVPELSFKSTTQPMVCGPEPSVKPQLKIPPRLIPRQLVVPKRIVFHKKS